MPQFSIQLAENRILVDALFDSTKEFCRAYLCNKERAVELHEKTSDITVAITSQDIEYEKQKSAEEDAAMSIPTRPFKDEYLETLAVYRKICDQMPERDTFLFHCSAVAVDGKAYLFTAPSGTGKSTHTRLWREVFGDRAVMINDDKPLLHVASESAQTGKDGTSAQPQVLVYGTPRLAKTALQPNRKSSSTAPLGTASTGSAPILCPQWQASACWSGARRITLSESPKKKPSHGCYSRRTGRRVRWRS